MKSILPGFTNKSSQNSNPSKTTKTSSSISPNKLRRTLNPRHQNSFNNKSKDGLKSSTKGSKKSDSKEKRNRKKEDLGKKRRPENEPNNRHSRTVNKPPKIRNPVPDVFHIVICIMPIFFYGKFCILMFDN